MILIQLDCIQNDNTETDKFEFNKYIHFVIWYRQSLVNTLLKIQKRSHKAYELDK